MADRRSDLTGQPENRRTTLTKAVAIAELLHRESSNLLELYKKRETFIANVISGDSRLVSVPPPSSQLDTRDKLWCLQTAFLQCERLMERAIAKEDEALGIETGEYKILRKMVSDRISYLVGTIGDVIKAMDGPALVTPSFNDSLEPDNLTVFEMKLWVFRVFLEVDHWAKTAEAVLQALPKERVKPTPRLRSTRRSRR
ncbi:ciliary neurotrophic factor [Stigmatopora nigra]